MRIPVDSGFTGKGFFGRLFASFGFAFAVIGHLWRTQQNIRIHAVCTVLVVALGLFLEVERRDWVALVLAVGLVWSFEGMNTAVELLADAACPEFHPLVGRCKDAAAAAVLLAALAAALVALLVYVPYLIDYFAPGVTTSS